MLAGAPPQTPLGKLTALSQTSLLLREGGEGWEGRAKEGRREGRGPTSKARGET